MSFILDALKKSESDRQRQSGPSLFEVKVAPPRRALPVWAVAIGALLAINIVVVSWMLLRHPAARQAAAPVAAETRQPAAGAANRAIAQDTAPPREAVPAAVSGSVAAAPPTNATPPPVAAAAPPPAPAASSTRPQGAAPAGAGDQGGGQATAGGDPSDYAPAVEPAGTQGSGVREGGADDLPLYQQVVGSANLPELHLDLHVFANRPRDRFVMINMHRLGEGDSLPDGVAVAAIRPDGVVLTYHGTRFLLPRN